MTGSDIEAAADDLAGRAEAYADEAFNAQHALRQQELAVVARIEAEGRERARLAVAGDDDDRGLPVSRRPVRPNVAPTDDDGDDGGDGDDERTWLR